jgi:putative restriction endonuclease
MRGTVAITDSPFFFKLRSPHNAICGYAFFARYSVLPDWLAWETFTEGNGTSSFRELRARILTIRERIRFRGASGTPEIGCILLVQPTFFEEVDWVDPPQDWPVRTQSHIGYDLRLARERVSGQTAGPEPASP